MPIDPVVAMQRDWLRKLQELTDMTDRPILIQRHKSNVWHPWFDDVPNNPYHTRIVLSCELCLDPDITHHGPYWGMMKEGMDKIITFLKGAGIPYILAYTGGKGVHLHIFFNTKIPLPETVVNGIDTNQLDVGNEIRSFLLKWILDGAVVDDEKFLKLDKAKTAWSRDGKGSMIKLFGCQHYDDKGKLIEGVTKTVIEEIQKERPAPRSLPLRFPEKIDLWDISNLLNDIVKLLESKIEEREKSQAAIQISRLRRLTTTHTSHKRKCLGFQRAEAGVQRGIRDEVAIGLICYYKKWLRIDQEQCQEFMYQWARRCSPAFESSIIDYKIKRIYSTEQAYPPCGFFKEAGLCAGSQCRVCME